MEIQGKEVSLSIYIKIEPQTLSRKLNHKLKIKNIVPLSSPKTHSQCGSKIPNFRG